MRTRARLLTALLAVALALGAPAPALAEDGGAGGDNTAVAVNTKDGASVFRFAFKIARVAGEVVDNTNAAVAYSQCESCQTTAIAIQIVLAMDEPSTVSPENFAIALNVECTLCQTFAGAYQFVLTTGGPVHFTAEGNREIAAVRREIQRLRHADLSPAELAARLDELIVRVRRVLAEELVPAGRGDGPGAQGPPEEPPPGQAGDEETTATTTTPTATGTATETEPATTAETGTETGAATETGTEPATTETAP